MKHTIEVNIGYVNWQIDDNRIPPQCSETSISVHFEPLTHPLDPSTDATLGSPSTNLFQLRSKMAQKFQPTQLLGVPCGAFWWRLLQLVSKACPTKDLASCVKWRIVFLVLCWGPKTVPVLLRSARHRHSWQLHHAPVADCCLLQFGFHLFLVTRLQVASSCCCLPYDSVLSCLVSKNRNHNPNSPTAWDVSGMAGKRGALFFNVQMWADCVCRSSNGDSNWKAVASKASSTCFCKYNYICKKNLWHPDRSWHTVQ